MLVCPITFKPEVLYHNAHVLNVFFFFSKLSDTIAIFFQFLRSDDFFLAFHYCEKARNFAASGRFTVLIQKYIFFTTKTPILPLRT